MYYISINLHLLGNTYWFLGQYEDAIELYKKVLKRSPNHLLAHINLTAAYSASGREQEARQQAQELLRLDPAFSLDRWVDRVSPLFEDKTRAEQYIADLRKAGLK